MFPWARGEQSFCPHGVSSLVWRNPNLLAKRDLFSLGCVLLQILGWRRIPTGTLSLCNSSLLVKFKLMVGNHGDDSNSWLVIMEMMTPSRDWMKNRISFGATTTINGSGCLECWVEGSPEAEAWFRGKGCHDRLVMSAINRNGAPHAGCAFSLLS